MKRLYANRTVKIGFASAPSSLIDPVICENVVLFQQQKHIQICRYFCNPKLNTIRIIDNKNHKESRCKIGEYKANIGDAKLYDYFICWQ